MKFIIYGTDNCKYCNMAKLLLQAYQLEFEYTDITDNESLKEIVRTDYDGFVPQIFKMSDKVGVHIGGFTELKDYLEALGYVIPA